MIGIFYTLKCEILKFIFFGLINVSLELLLNVVKIAIDKIHCDLIILVLFLHFLRLLFIAIGCGKIFTPIHIK